jgi:hypothetical protein
VDDVLRERGKIADLERERQCLERLILNSFRVIEAILGEPGKDKDKFRRKMSSCGLNFDERVGFRGTRRVALGEEIYRLQELRDSTSAHGVRRRKKPVSWFEAMGAQSPFFIRRSGRNAVGRAGRLAQKKNSNTYSS